jgi:methionine sulfoxide reductase heme-binding subunit
MIVASTELAWYLTRSSGFVALILLTASVALGVLAMARLRTSAWPRFVTQALHRNVSLLAVCFLGAHIATTVLDGFAPIGWLDAVVPFLSPYRPIWLGLGALALDLLIAVVVTSLIRRHIGYRAWLAVHLTSWLAWPVAVLHGLGTGSDSQTGWGQAVYVACAAVVLVACWCRLAIGWPSNAGTRILGAIASVVLPVLVVAWALAGPMQPGWAKRAGTPAAPSGSSAGATATVPVGTAGGDG